jgi:hypothetical protein
LKRLERNADAAPDACINSFCCRLQPFDRRPNVSAAWERPNLTGHWITEGSAALSPK